MPGSPYGRAVLATLIEKDAPCRVVAVPPESIRKEPHISRHPFGRVPVLEHDGFVLYETQAMVRYVDRAVPGKPLTPQDIRAAARMDQIMNISDWYLFHGVNSVIGFQRIVGPRVLSLSPDEAAIAAAKPKAHKVFRELERLLGTNEFLAGSQLSLADMMAVTQLDLLSETPEWAALTAETPNLVSWLARMNARKSLKETTWEKVNLLARAA
ncbi:MAG: glutathione S-transferase family protein [Steroidobacteraceae bacterium]|nr:glutathione S-transferase family protein [Steroidobacteraceae bacterium]